MKLVPLGDRVVLKRSSVTAGYLRLLHSVISEPDVSCFYLIQ